MIGTHSCYSASVHETEFVGVVVLRMQPQVCRSHFQLKQCNFWLYLFGMYVMVVAVMSRSFVFGMDVSDVSCASASTSAVAELALTPGNNIQMLRWFEERSP